MTSQHRRLRVVEQRHLGHSGLRDRYHTFKREAALMTLVGCDLHTRKQQVAALDTETGEIA